jgi:hypothetical protein
MQASSQDKELAVHPRVAMCSAAPDLSPCRRGLQRCHVSYSSGSRLPAEAGSGAAMCPVALDLASLSEWAPVLPRVM